MNDTLQAFWYRPLWQRMLPVSIFISVCLTIGYYGYWQENARKIVELKNENNQFITNIHQDIQFVRQFPSLFQLEQQVNLLAFKIEPQKFIPYLPTLIIDSGVILNQLQPSDTEELYQLEVQGSFIQIYHFISMIISQPTTNRWRFSELKITAKNGYLTALISISSMKNHSFTKDDSSDEQ